MKVETEASTTVSDRTTETTDAVLTGSSTAETQKNEHENSYYILFFPPDSTGKQYPQMVAGTDKTNNVVITAREDWEHIVKSQFDYLFTKIDQLEQQVNEQQKTDSKSGLTLLEKIGLGAIGMIFLSIIFAIIKLYLKTKKLEQLY